MSSLKERSLIKLKELFAVKSLIISSSYQYFRTALKRSWSKSQPNALILNIKDWQERRKECISQTDSIRLVILQLADKDVTVGPTLVDLRLADQVDQRDRVVVIA